MSFVMARRSCLLLLLASLALSAAHDVDTSDLVASVLEGATELALNVSGTGTMVVMTQQSQEFVYNATNFPGSEAMAHFLVVGDWGYVGAQDDIGRPECPEDFQFDFMLGAQQQQQTALQMDQLCTTMAGGCDLVLNTGDNFYPCGVYPGETQRFYNTWIDQYKDSERTPAIANLTWYHTFGNHDYVINGSVHAQMEFEKLSADWVFPDLNFVRDIELGHGATMRLVSLDTNTMATYYVESPKYGVNEYMQLYATEEYVASVVEFAVDAMATSEATYTVLLSHYPLYGTSVQYASNASVEISSLNGYPGLYNGFADLMDAINTYKPVAWFNGHDHSLTLGNPSTQGPVPWNNYTVYVTTGSAGQGGVNTDCGNVDSWLYSNGANTGFVMASANETAFIVNYFTSGSMFSQCTVTSFADGSPPVVSDNCMLGQPNTCCFQPRDNPTYCGW